MTSIYSLLSTNSVNEIKLIKKTPNKMFDVYQNIDISHNLESEPKLNCVFFIVDPSINKQLQPVICIPNFEYGDFTIRYVIINIVNNKIVSPNFEYSSDFQKKRLINITDDDLSTIDSTEISVNNIKIFVPQTPLLFRDYQRNYKLINKMQFAATRIDLQARKDNLPSIPTEIMQHNIAPFVNKSYKGGRKRKNKKNKTHKIFL